MASLPVVKLVTDALPKTYDPVGTEARWQQAWETSGAFHPDPAAPGEPFAVVIPPPNVTGSLHMGHAFNTALIDTIVRYQRLAGRNVLCLPGTDHASIAVQTILEKQLKADGLRKEDLGREAFLEKAWAWKAQSGGTIVGQLRRLGYSVDWQRERFTLDTGCSAAVVEAFNRLHEQGLIYRGEYLVNWCPASGSAVSDLEVEMKEVDGHLWHFRYPLSGGAAADGRTHLEVATTRPETLLGDTAVAVNPRDPRYSALVGQTLTLPLVGRQIPIVADEHVDAEFGTGCVKVTPAHDPNDFAIGQRHNLPLITVMTKDGSMNDAAGRFAGLDRFEARQAVVAAMEAEGFLVKVEPYRHSVPFSDRGKVPVEPLLSTQWFVRTEPLAARCREALEAAAGPEPRFVPERWAKVYRDWLTDIRDWCISRQLWWGHRIPAWFVVSETGGVITDSTPYVVARNEAEARARAEAQFGGDAVLEQDPDA
ncbi:MAG: valine--tRNA ligase, partial [Cyanobacteria bacterium K_DeepCast_35m_m2_155]|nr:valine--tRNA ligase [Cyanobacteria bacterium K_DeepCast_35m_m2_155]